MVDLSKETITRFCWSNENSSYNCPLSLHFEIICISKVASIEVVNTVLLLNYGMNNRTFSVHYISYMKLFDVVNHYKQKHDSTQMATSEIT